MQEMWPGYRACCRSQIVAHSIAELNGGRRRPGKAGSDRRYFWPEMAAELETWLTADFSIVNEYKNFQELPAHGTVLAKCHAAPGTAGFYRVTCAFQTDNHDTVSSTTKILGLKPDELEAPLTREPDFD